MITVESEFAALESLAIQMQALTGEMRKGFAE